ncbi:MAG: ribonuclease R [Candidatus Paceibacterota bacterium]
MQNNQKTIEATIAISKPRKLGFIKNPNTQQDVAIRLSDIKHALPGDTVRVELNGQKIEEMEQGVVVEIVKRLKTKFVGTAQKTGGDCFIIPDNQKVYVYLNLSPEEAIKVEHNDKVYVVLDSWDEKDERPLVKVLQVIGKKGVHEVEIRSIILEKGFDAEFPESVLRDADELKKEWSPIPESEISKRRDMRGTLTMTIDPIDAKDFDDAISFKILDSGNYEIGVHIADVAHYVTPGTIIDKEAYERQFSVYLVDRTIPMLPEVLSNDLCSLNPNEEKLSFSAIFEINKNAEIVDEWFGRTIIKSDKRFTYENAQETLDAGTGEYFEELNTLNTIAKKLAEKKFAAGAIRFTSEEFKFELDDKGVPIAIHKKPHLETHSLVEDFMLLANRHVARFIFDQCSKGDGSCSLMYRVHNLPDKDKISELSVFTKALGYVLNINKDGTVTAKDLNALFAQVAGKAEESLITSAAIKTMAKAIYSTENSGHFGLAFEYYTHFTSPIRRYPDLVVHRILAKLIAGESISDVDALFFQRVANHASAQEVAAQEAERASIKYKQTEFMMNHVGEEFEGIISGVAPFGMFVVLNETGAEGMIHISKLGEDYWNLDEKKYRIVGEKTGKFFTLGDKLKVRIEAVDLDNRKLEMRLV